jgi:type 1 glutamine amidotransferase
MGEPTRTPRRDRSGGSLSGSVSQHRVALVVAAVVAGAALLLACAAPDERAERAPSRLDDELGGTGTAPAVDTPDSVLVLTATQGFRHDSIEPAAESVRTRLIADGDAVEVTGDPGALTTEHLAGVDVVVFLSTTGDVLDDAQQDALQSWVEGGGGWVGIHGALDAEYDWPFYEMLAGAWFQAHPAVQEATVRVEDPTHPATAHLPTQWVRTDEWYDLRTNPRANPNADVHVLATVDESTYEGATMGADHPIAWCSTIGDGQTFVTAMGHTVESWSDPAFVDHVVGGIAAVTEPGSCA